MNLNDMKFLLPFLFLGTSLTANAQQLYAHAMNVKTNDLVYDANTDRVYISIPSTNGVNGNSIGIVNTSTLELENTVFIGSEPTVLAISDNGEYIYSGFSGASIVRRFDVADQEADAEFNLGSDSFFGSYFVEDIEVMPGYPNTVAVSRKRSGVSPRHGGVAIYDKGIQRPTTTPGHTGSNRIEFTSSDALIGYNNETTEFGIRDIQVDMSGVTNTNVYGNVVSGFQEDFILHENRMYFTNGRVVNLSSGTPTLVGQFADVTGAVTYDTYNDLVCFASYDYWDETTTFKRFNPNTFLLYDEITVPQFEGFIKSLVTCGENCYAYNHVDGQLIIINEDNTGLSITDVNSNTTVFPNPTVNLIHVKSESEIIEVSLHDVNGRIVANFTDVNKPLSIGHLSSGIYFVKVKDEYGHISVNKVVKK